MSQHFTLPANKPDDRDRILSNLLAFIDRLPDSKSWRITIDLARKGRSDQQNRALFGVAYPILADATGYTVDELHAAFCRKFFGTTCREIAGIVIERPVRTTTTNEQGKRELMLAEQFSAFYAMVQRDAAEIGVDVPDPDPLHGDER